MIEAIEEVLGHVKCTKQPAQIVAKSAKYLSYQPRADQCIVGTATRNIRSTDCIL